MRKNIKKTVEYWFRESTKEWIKKITIQKVGYYTVVRKCPARFLILTHVNHFYYWILDILFFDKVEGLNE